MRKLASLLLSLVSIAGAASAFAQTDYPTRPVRIVVAQGAGGSPDVLARLMAQELTHRFGQPFVVQNMPGAAGTIGTSHVAKAAPDGYTLLVTTEASLVTNPILNSKFDYDPEKDLTPITQLVQNSYYAVACPKLPVSDLTDIVAHSKKSEMSYGSSGFGTVSNLAGEMLKKVLKINMTHVPYRSAPATMTDVAACNIQMAFPAFNTGFPLIQAGKIKGIAVSSQTRRSETPDVPTLRELGFPEMEEVEASHHLLAPANTPEAIVRKVHGAVVEIMGSDQMKKTLDSRGMVLKTKKSPQAYGKALAEMRERYRAIITEAKMPMQ